MSAELKDIKLKTLYSRRTSLQESWEEENMETFRKTMQNFESETQRRIKF